MIEKMNEEMEQIKEEVIELLKNKRYTNLNKYPNNSFIVIP